MHTEVSGCGLEYVRRVPGETVNSKSRSGQLSPRSRKME